MATYQEIFTQAGVELNKEPTDKAGVVTALKAYYDTFHPFFVIGNGYLRGGKPFFTQDNTLAQMKNQMYSQIEAKNTCGFMFEVAPGVTLKVRFVVRENMQMAIRVQITRPNNTWSEEHINQEAAAAILAKIVLRYKDA